MKRIFITGASSGIGLATATLLSGRGDEVWGTSRDLSRIPPLPRLHGVQLDLLDPLSLADNFDAALRQAGQFDVMINNAGTGHFGPAEFLSPEEVHLQFQILVFAHIQLCQLALRAMRDRGGRIINVTSLVSRLPIPFMGAYNAAKAAMASFNATLQLDAEQKRPLRLSVRGNTGGTFQGFRRIFPLQMVFKREGDPACRADPKLS